MLAVPPFGLSSDSEPLLLEDESPRGPEDDAPLLLEDESGEEGDEDFFLSAITDAFDDGADAFFSAAGADAFDDGADAFDDGGTGADAFEDGADAFDDGADAFEDGADAFEDGADAFEDAWMIPLRSGERRSADGAEGCAVPDVVLLISVGGIATTAEGSLATTLPLIVSSRQPEFWVLNAFCLCNLLEDVVLTA